MKPKLLCILHYSPPVHGASMVGDFIKSSYMLNDEFECKYIKIKSSHAISDIGKVNVKKLYYVSVLFLKVLWSILIFRPDKIYFTASIKKIAFYRDLLISTLWKSYAKVKKVEVFYHYHTKGINKFVTSSKFNLKLTRFFLKNVNLILLSPLCKMDFQKIKTYKYINILPNGVVDPFQNKKFESYINVKFRNKSKTLEVLYLSNMIKEKGYFKLVELAKNTKEKNIHFHFAGAWMNHNDEKEFYDYIEHNKLKNNVTFHGFINDNKKLEIFQKVDFLIFPTRYHNEVFGLVIIEAMSYGVPVIASDEGSIPYILDDKSGIVLKDLSKLSKALIEATNNLISIETSYYCRKRFLENFTVEKFEFNLINILK